jgi:hypothetical protein
MGLLLEVLGARPRRTSSEAGAPSRERTSRDLVPLACIPAGKTPISAELSKRSRRRSSSDAALANTRRIFLAHAREDKPQVRKLHADLKARGLEPWLDEVDLMPGQLWKIEIPKAIRDAGPVPRLPVEPLGREDRLRPYRAS